jgi:hypothetical protein
MTTSIYQNPFVFEKHNKPFSDYIGLCITHHKDEKGENTEFHHIFPKHKGGTNHRWNKVHLEYELHVEAHRLLMEAFSEDKSLRSSYTLTKNRGSNRGEGNPMHNRTHTTETKDKQREKALERETNGFAGKTHTSEANEKNRLAHLNKTATKETRVKMRESQKNSEYNLNRPKKNCPFCDRIIDISNYDKHVKSCINNPESMKYKKLIEFQIYKG